MASSRRQYPFHLIEPKWQQFWDRQQTFRAFNPGEAIPAAHPFAQRHQLTNRKPSAIELPPKFYILDMFPYPSGAGLHVGHPEGYTATDILSRYRRAQGFNVLHPMGWDAFGLPAEQYAIRTGQHPRQTTEENIANFKRQIQSLGFSYDWSREVDTTDPDYFRWTQWIFLKLYNSYFDPELQKAQPVELLEDALSDQPRKKLLWNSNTYLTGTHEAWLKFSAEEKRFRREFINRRRLAYVTEAPVWWCEELGTVLANEEVVDGKSEVGGHPVKRRWLFQWTLRITAYAERLLQDLKTIEWSDSLKEMQRNWIGRSEGVDVIFQVVDVKDADGNPFPLCVFTTRPDTLFGATYMVVAPEHELIKRLIEEGRPWPGGTPENWKGELVNGQSPNSPSLAMLTYQAQTIDKGELERTALSKEKTGVFTGVFAKNPASSKEVPIWMADYVLGGYGPGAIMAVPAHDERDFEFAKKFKLPITPVVMPSQYWLEKNVADYINISSDTSSSLEHKRFLDLRDEAYFQAIDTAYCDDGIAVNSSTAQFTIDGLKTENAKWIITEHLEFKGLGKKTINYKLRDWLFSRQRYWGEPFPIVWKKSADGSSYHEALPESALPLLPPKLDDYKPTPDGQPPLARAKDWVNLPDGATRETNTMPQWAGSCWYYLRYLDAQNAAAFVGKEAEHYWMGADGRRSDNTGKPATCNLQPATDKSTTPGVDLYVGGTEHAVLHLLYARFWHKVLFDLGYVSTPEPFFKLVNQGLILGEDGQKMSKSRGNVVNPDDILKEYGADAFRLYEMFMGPLQDTKPWNTKGVEGVYRFLGRVWRLFVDEKSETEFEQAETIATETQRHRDLLELIRLSPAIKEIQPTAGQLKPLHACIKKVTEDLDGLRFNTAISAMMVFVNEAMTWETKPASVSRTFLQLLAPFAPHLAEELWAKLSTLNSQPSTSLGYQPWPKFDPALLVEDTLEIPVQVNGKLRDVIKVPANAPQADIEAAAKASEKVQPFLDGKTIRKVIVVPKKLVNIVVG